MRQGGTSISKGGKPASGQVRPDPDDSALEAFAQSRGKRLVSHTRLKSTISGNGLVVAHEVELASETDVEKLLVYVETSPPDDERDGVLTVVDESTGEDVAIWVYPDDPALPALQTAVYPDAAGELLRRLGVSIAEEVSLKLEAYRPGKRAVIRVDSRGSAVFLKVVKPGVAPALAERHRDWLEAGVPVPEVLGWSDEGLLTLAALRGIPALDAISRISPEEFVTSLIDLQEQIARVPSSDAARNSLASRLSWYERRVTASAPDHAEGIHGLARNIEELLTATPAGSAVTIHGDLHLGQLFLDDKMDAIDGVLDIDTAGLGDQADDAAALYAHLVVTMLANSAQTTIVSACDVLADHWAKSWHAREDSSFATRASAIAATHLLAHALNRPSDTAALLDHAERLLAGLRSTAR